MSPRRHHDRDGGFGHVFDESDGFQFLPPRADLFGSGPVEGHAGGEPVADAFRDDEPTPRRWLTVAGGLGVLALIAVGVLAASPWSGDDEGGRRPVPTPATTQALAPPTTTLRRITGPAVPPTPATLSPAVASEVLDAFLIDPSLLPSSMAPLPAMMPNDDEDVPGSGWLEVWAAPGASRLDGRWFSFGYELGVGNAQASSATRIALADGAPAIRWTEPDGVSGLMFERGSATVTFTWHGLSEAEALGMAASVVAARAGTPELAAGSAPSDLVRRVADRSTSAHPPAAYLYAASASVTYADEDGTFLTVSTIDRSAGRVALAPFVVAGGPASSPASIDIGGRPVSLLTIAPGGWDRSTHVVAEWTEGDRLVQISGGPAQRLLALVPLVRRGTVGEWWDLARQEPHRSGADRPQEASDVVAGHLPDTGGWTAEVYGGAERAIVRLSPVAFPTTGIVMIDLSAGPCGSVADLRTTTVACVVAARPEVADAGTMTIRGEAGEQGVAMSHPVGSPWAAGIVAHRAMGAYEVSVTSPSGAPLGALVVPADGAA